MLPDLRTISRFRGSCRVFGKEGFCVPVGKQEVGLSVVSCRDHGAIRVGLCGAYGYGWSDSCAVTDGNELVGAGNVGHCNPVFAWT